MMVPLMNRFLPLLLAFAVGFAFLPHATAQDSFAGVDLLYPEFAHPRQDAAEAIKGGDLRFIAIDRYGKDLPGVERYPRLKEIQGTKPVRQSFRIFTTRSQDFSFAIRARAYADEFNRTLLQHLLKKRPKN